MREIPLTKGCVALVDDEDYERVAIHRWYAFPIGRTVYAARGAYRNGRQITTYLHREVLDAPVGVEVDHRNGDGLDNRRSNLRLATRGQNNRNRRGANRDSRTGALNVYWMPQRKSPYRVVVSVHGRRVDGGYFTTLAEAEAAATALRQRRIEEEGR